MSQNSHSEDRRGCAQTVRSAAPTVAAAVTEEFFRRHPSWLNRYGPAGVERGVEDATFHVRFLAAAIEYGGAAAFADYLRWAARLLLARSILPPSLVENMEQVRDALCVRLGESDAGTVREIVDEALAAFMASDAPSQRGVLTSAGTVYLAAALEGQRAAALRVALEALAEGESLTEIYCGLLQDTQIEVGRLWETNRISVAQEHLATAVTQYVVAHVYAATPAVPATRGCIIVTGVRGELHQLGAGMVADVLEAHGWDARFLGSHLPHTDVVHQVETHKAAVVAISATLVLHLPEVADLIRRIRESDNSSVRVVVGGRAFAGQENVWRELGADGYARDLRSAVSTVDSLVAR